MIRKTINTIKTKRFDFKLDQTIVTKSADGDCVIEGYANTSAKDRVGDVVLPKAFEKTLETYLKNPVLLANHDWNDPCGMVMTAEVTDKGLWIKAKISNTREDIKTLIREGCLRTFSIGYNEVDAEYDESTKTKYIKELELLEISVVTVPANTEAMFTQASAKTETEAGTEKAKEEEAKSAPKSAKSLKSFIDMVKSVVGKSLNETEVEAVCSYFINEEDNHMTKEQLIAALSAKSVDAAAAPVAPEAKAEEAAPAEQPQDGDMMKELMAKIDAIGQAMAQILEGMQPKADAEEPAKEEEAPAKEEAKAEEEPKDEQEEDMEEEEVEKQLAELEAEIAAIEDNESI